MAVSQFFNNYASILASLPMSASLYVAFVWHQHQPLYKSPTIGKYRLPWVRLHGIKDYLDLVLMLEKFPNLHQTVNLVPSLIVQLQEYIDGTAFDPYLELTLTPVATMGVSQRQFIIRHFFDAHHSTMVEPYPRYAQLLRQKKQKGESWCLENWTDQDYSDLLAWHNLTWFDPLFRERDPQIQQWFERGQGFNLSDRQLIYSKQKEILSQIMPTHRAMQERGQLELITSPYTHPIMPILADSNVGRVAVPQMLLPGIRYRWENDISLHLEKSKQIYRQYFGTEPRGLWPSEQSVSPAILPYVSRYGFQWLCSDEAVLGWSLGHYFRRDEYGNITEPELLYQPYRLETMYGDLAITFRDHRLSDLIGFSYSSMSPEAASDHLLTYLKKIYSSWQTGSNHDSNHPWLVTIALDGENCWEYYQNDGKDFLQTLYSQIDTQDWLKLVTVSEFITEFPPIEKIPPHQLHSGSWIDANFTTWIGDPVKNRAWELLAEARQILANHPEATQENNPEVWEHLFAAEGSDWFWWFGEGHSSDHDYIFDQLFREHLQGLYRALNEPVPQSLLYPLEPHDLSLSQQPQNLIHPTIDGKLDKQDWQGAGCMDIGSARGTMHQNSVVRKLWYGLDHFNFYLRLDFSDPVLKLSRDQMPYLHLFWFYPEKMNYNSPILLDKLPQISPLDYLFHHHLEVDIAQNSLTLKEAIDGHDWQILSNNSCMAFDQCLEIALPWYDIKIEPQSSAKLVVILSRDRIFQMSLPECTIIPVDVP
jgi:alpha-amylase/alpha-mannosidase (GH57 family)